MTKMTIRPTRHKRPRLQPTPTDRPSSCHKDTVADVRRACPTPDLVPHWRLLRRRFQRNAMVDPDPRRS